LAASDEAVPQLKLTASEEELQLKRSRTRGEKALKQKKNQNSLWLQTTIVLLSKSGLFSRL
jgi:hypothetical protein